MKIKPRCLKCNCLFLGGQDGVCDMCLSRKPRKRKSKPLRCLCGKRAVAVLLAMVYPPDEEPLELEIPLCRECMEIERSMEAPGASVARFKTEPSCIVVVKSLPRVPPSSRGRSL